MSEAPPTVDLEVVVCRAMSGFSDLSPRFANAAIGRIRLEYGDDMVQALLHQFANAGADGIAADLTLQPPLRQLLLFLYTGFTQAMGDDSGVPENHFESLMWRAALAHPPGLSGGYFGHWHYPPEDRHD